jgi:Na+-driven multidrug efflux pump
VNSYGVNAAAAVGIAGRFDSFAMLPASAMAMAVASTSAQNIGAGLYDRAKQAMKVGIKISVSFAVVIFFFVQIYPEAVLRIFTSNVEVIKAGALYMRAFSLDFIMVSFVFCMDGFFNGCGHSNFAMANGLLSTFLVRVPLAYILSKVAGQGLFGVGLAAPLASSLSIILGGWYILSNRWKKSRIL